MSQADLERINESKSVDLTFRVKEAVFDFFRKTGLKDLEVKVVRDDPAGPVSLDVFTEDGSLYIGEKGRNLEELDRILKIFLKKKFPEFGSFYFDINNYQRSRYEVIRDLARQAARKVRQSKAPLILSPMGARERKIIHLELSGHPDIKTESIGEGLERRVVVKYLE